MSAKLNRSSGELDHDQLLSAVYKTFQAFMDDQYVPKFLSAKTPVDLPDLPERSKFCQVLTSCDR
jgi:hypothetical protein